jgi:hypothetical protein
VAVGAFQVRVVACPIDSETAEALKEITATGALGTTTVPVPPGSRTDLRVVVPVLLVVSEIEAQTAAREVKSAMPLVPFGTGGFATGHEPYPEGSVVVRPKLSEPTK